MAADVDLLPLPYEECNVRYGYYADTVTDYARACVEHNVRRMAAVDPLAVLARAQQAEARVEALRAEGDEWRQAAITQSGEMFREKDRAERLAEAGRRVTAAFRAHGEASPFTRQAERTRHECEAAMLALDAALEQEEGK